MMAKVPETQSKPPFFQECLESEYMKRKEKNASYSLRAFAKMLKVDHGIVAAVIAGRRVPSNKVAMVLVDSIGIAPERKKVFLNSVEEERRRRSFSRINRSFKDRDSLRVHEPVSIPSEKYAEISRWYHLAIMELTVLQDFSPEPSWISKRLGITENEALDAVNALCDVGILERVEGTVKKVHQIVLTDNRDHSSSFLKQRQREILEKAIVNLETTPVKERNQSAMTMAIDPDKITEAKRMIDEFMVTLCSFLESGNQRRIYEFSASLFPLDQIQNVENKMENHNDGAIE